jgi:hypothetical protein
MEDNVRKELDMLVLKLNDWRNSYLRQAEGHGDEYLIQELHEDISTWMAPYVRRLHEMEYITNAEEAEFWGRIKQSYDEFVQDIHSGKSLKQEEEVDIKDLLNKFRVHKDFIEMNLNDKDFLSEQKAKLVEVALKLIPALEKKMCKCGGSKKGVNNGC